MTLVSVVRDPRSREVSSNNVHVCMDREARKAYTISILFKESLQSEGYSFQRMILVSSKEISNVIQRGFSQCYIFMKI